MSTIWTNPVVVNDQIKVCVINDKGKVTFVECKTRLSVDRIKLSALTNFIGDQVVAFKTVDQYRIVSIAKKRILSCETSIRDEGLTCGDTLLLLENGPIQGVTLGCDTDPMLDGPSMDSILEATKLIEPKNDQYHLDKMDTIDKFKSDLRPIFVTLVNFTSTILQYNPIVQLILKDVQPFDAGDLEKVNVRRKRKSNSIENEEKFDLEAVRQLANMGFSVERCKRALRMSNNSPTEAIDWLMAYGTSSSTFKQSQVIPSTSADQSSSPLTCQMYPRVPGVIDCVNKYFRRNFVPNRLRFTDLQNLGFEDDEILDALWRFHNNQNLTTEWLINEDRPSLNDLCQGLTYDHPFIKEILNSPDFLVYLIKPKIFLALVSLAEHLDPRELLMDDEIATFSQALYQLYHYQNFHSD